MRMNRRRDVIVTSLKFHKSAGEVRGGHLIEILFFKTRAKKLHGRITIEVTWLTSTTEWGSRLVETV